MRLIHLLLISSLMRILYCMYVYIIFIYLRKYFVIHITAKLLTNSSFPTCLMVRSGISEALH